MQMFELQVGDDVFGSAGQSAAVWQEIVPMPPVQAPPMQLWPLAQTLPQVPQLLGLVKRLVSQPLFTL
jgi:hypothetical protein